MVDLTLDVHERGGWTVVTLAGELDAATAPRLRQRLVGLIDGGSLRLLVELDAVGVLDSTGLGVLIGAVKRVRGRGGDLAVACSEPRLRRIFELTRLDRAIDVHAHHPEVPA